MIYLDVPFREKDQAKQLGARWDAVSKRWYIPDDKQDDKQAFARWLADSDIAQSVQDSNEFNNQSALNLLVNPSFSSSESNSLPLDSSMTENKGISLSMMLNKVQTAIRLQIPGANWVVAEIANLNTRRGHFYLELTETNEQGQTLATCRAMIWQSQATPLLKTFETQTGSALEAGQKVLLLAEASFHQQYGFSLVIQDIDASFTLGEQERKLQEIRKNLLEKGVYQLNKQLELPSDFFRIAVVAPVQAAGLGDFRADADILQNAGLCEFKYFYSSFQGNAVEAELTEAFKAVESLHKTMPYDALVIIRGGGAKLDLNQLNIESVAEAVCHLNLPVLSGIGHERDNTIIDEVANRRFDTPSKVIGFIKQQIFEQAQNAKNNWQSIEKSSAVRVHYLHNKINQLHMLIQQNTQRAVHSWKSQLEPLQNNIKHLSVKAISQYEQKIESHNQVVAAQVNQNLQRNKMQTEQLIKKISTDAVRAIEIQKKQIIQSISFILSSGPKVQLNRGFAIVKDSDDQPITSANKAIQAKEIQVEFSDATIQAIVKSEH